MPIKRISLISILLSLLISSLHAQSNPYGLPRIQNYHFSETGGGEQNWCITQDFRGVIYVGNHNNGILEYDGSTWRTLPVPGDAAVRSLVSGEDNYIYVGLEGDFGRLEPDQMGDLHFRSLKDSTSKKLFPDEIIWKTYYKDGIVYFCGMEAIFVFDTKAANISIIKATDNAFFSFFIDQELYLGDFKEGLLKYDGDSFAQVRGGGFFKGLNISGLVTFDSTQLLVATINKGLYLLNLTEGTIDSTFVSPGLKEDLGEAVLISLQIRSNIIFAGTLLEGLFVLDREGSLQEVLSEREGLIDNAMAYMHIPQAETDSYSIWIAHWKGVSKVDINSPFRSMSVGQGGMGMGGRNTGELITDITEFQGQQYVSTLGGLQRRSENVERPGFRPVRGIRGAIHNLAIVKPMPGLEFLMAIGDKQTYVIDQHLKLSTLEAGGQKLLIDPHNPAVFYTGGYYFKGFHYQNGLWKEILKIELKEETYQMCYDRHKNVWISTHTELLRLNLSGSGEGQILKFGSDKGLPTEDNMALFTDPESRELRVATGNGIYHYDYDNDTFSEDTLYISLFPEGENEIMTIHQGSDDLYWFSFENEYSGWSILGARRKSNGFELIYDRPFRGLSQAASTDVFYTDANNELWFSKSHQLFHFDQSHSLGSEDSIRVLMRYISISGDSILFYGSHYRADAKGHLRPYQDQAKDSPPEISYDYRDIEFQWSAPYFLHERRIRYSYFLEGFSNEWSDWGRSRSAKFTNLPHGRYVMQVKARNIYGDESPPASYAISISRPWYATFVAISLYIFLSISLAVFVVLYTRSLKHRAELLQRQNREIELQKKELENLNEEITAQRDEIEAQRDSITVQNELIGRQKNAMTDSIHYARRIQDAVLPAKEVMRYLLPKHFVFYRPRDIVSGDFFWVDKKDETVWMAVADCTGHGVPGAFMSMLGISLLNEISGQYSGQPTHEIMDELRDQVIASLGQTGDRYEAKDGLEMGLVAINTKTREVQFTGAMHNLYTFQKGELVVIRGDRVPVGIHTEGNTLFTSHKLTLERGDTLYLFSDGYPDQFGGKDRKKYGSSRLKALLTQLQNNIMHDQKEAIKKEFDQWKGKQEQIDDVLMIGIKL